MSRFIDLYFPVEESGTLKKGRSFEISLIFEYGSISSFFCVCFEVVGSKKC